MGKNLTSISGTSGPPHPLQSTIQPILGVLEQFWPKNLAEQANPTASRPQAARAPFPPPAENALFGSIFDFLKNTPQADLSGFEVPPGV